MQIEWKEDMSLVPLTCCDGSLRGMECGLLDLPARLEAPVGQTKTTLEQHQLQAHEQSRGDQCASLALAWEAGLGPVRF